MKNFTLSEKMNYLEKKFNAPMDIIMQTINYCKKNNLCITEITLGSKKNKQDLIRYFLK